MAQRLMIARALMHSPDVLFLDEPTNNLDPQSRLFVWDRIRTLNEQGMTILLTTHDMEEADKLCERIAIMDHGKILVNDTPAELKMLVPGGNTLEVRVYVPELAAVAVGGLAAQPSVATEHVRAALRALPGVSQVDELGQQAADTAGRGPGGYNGARVAAGAGRGPWTGMGGAPMGAGGAPPPEPGVTTFRLYTQDTTGVIAAAAQAVLATGVELRDLHLSRATLEDVFIYLTGRQLR
jgi:ABC-2 type transport system ATP-binding protein